MLTAQDNQLLVRTKTLSATFDNGVLTSLKRNSDGRQFVRQEPEGLFGMGLLYPNAEYVPLGGADRDQVIVRLVNDHRAEIRFACWNGDGVLAISEDIVNGDLIVEPSGYASRPGLRACRWAIGGIDKSLELVAPFFQGVRLPMEDPLIHNTRWHWPHFWEAALAIFQGEGAGGGFWVHSRDTAYRYKALQVGMATQPRMIGLETEAYGPLDNNLASGGLAWRLNVYEGDWQVPAGIYRDWLDSTWKPGAFPRPDWAGKIRLAMSWCPTEEGILDILSQKLPPQQVLLHIPFWRTEPYDENYPTYRASPQGKSFIRKAQAMGFAVMPHFNSIDMDPTHPVYTFVRDFGYRDVESKRIQGWTWDGAVKPVQESNAARLIHRDKKTMVKIHPGLALWRSILAENVGAAVADLNLEAVFLDVTLNTWNLHNCLVENQTPTEGMQRLIDEVAALKYALAMGGEGRNEHTMRNQCFGQVHLFKSWHESTPGLERTGRAALCEFLFGKWCRSIGYSGMNGKTAESQMRMDLGLALGAIPTLVIASAEELANPTPKVKQTLDLAKA